MMYKNMRNSRPLEIGRFQKKKWEKSGYDCFAIVDDKENVKKIVETYARILLKRQSSMFAVLWFFDLGMSIKVYSNLFSDNELIEGQEDLLIYEIQKENELNSFLRIWGEIDHLEFVFPKERESFLKNISKREYFNFNWYRRNFLKRVLNSVAIISDSGDGNEAQFVIEEQQAYLFE